MLNGVDWTQLRTGTMSRMTVSVPESSWTGLIAIGREEPAMVGLRLPVKQSESGLAGSFLALGIDGRRWWVKPPHQGDWTSH